MFLLMGCVNSLSVKDVPVDGMCQQMELLAAGAEEEAIQRVVHSNMAVLVDAAMRVS